MKILPPAQREAMFEIYGLCRRVDDIADSEAPRAERLIELAAWRADVNALYAGEVPPRLAGRSVGSVMPRVRSPGRHSCSTWG